MVKGNHFGELTAAAGALAAVGILVLIMTLMVDVRFAGATFPGQPGKIAYFSPVGSPRHRRRYLHDQPKRKWSVPSNQKQYGRLRSFLLAKRQVDSLCGLGRTRLGDLHHRRSR